MVTDGMFGAKVESGGLTVWGNKTAMCACLGSVALHLGMGACLFLHRPAAVTAVNLGQTAGPGRYFSVRLADVLDPSFDSNPNRGLGRDGKVVAAQGARQRLRWWDPAQLREPSAVDNDRPSHDVGGGLGGGAVHGGRGRLAEKRLTGGRARTGGGTPGFVNAEVARVTRVAGPSGRPDGSEASVCWNGRRD